MSVKNYAYAEVYLQIVKTVSCYLNICIRNWDFTMGLCFQKYIQKISENRIFNIRLNVINENFVNIVIEVLYNNIYCFVFTHIKTFLNKRLEVTSTHTAFIIFNFVSLILETYHSS